MDGDDPRARAYRSAGGRYWETGDRSARRLYFNGLAGLGGWEITRYRTSGNVASARLLGEAVSNSRAAAALGALATVRVYYDLGARRLLRTGNVYARSRCRGLAEATVRRAVEEIERRARAAFYSDVVEAALGRDEGRAWSRRPGIRRQRRPRPPGGRVRRVKRPGRVGGPPRRQDHRPLPRLGDVPRDSAVARVATKMLALLERRVEGQFGLVQRR